MFRLKGESRADVQNRMKREVESFYNNGIDGVIVERTLFLFTACLAGSRMDSESDVDRNESPAFADATFLFALARPFLDLFFRERTFKGLVAFFHPNFVVFNAASGCR